MSKKLKIKILKVYEKEGLLRVETETEFGKDNLGLSLDQKYLDPATGLPKWQKEIRLHLEKKYLKENAIEKEVSKEMWDTEI